MLVLADESLVVCWWTALEYGHHGDVALRRYSRTGTLLNDYGSFGDVVDPRIAYAADDPVSFWFDQKPYPDTGAITVKRIRASDGVVVLSVPTVTFEQGAYSGTPTLTPPARFGRSSSCPLIVLPPEGSGGTVASVEDEVPYVAPSYHPTRATSGGSAGHRM